MQRLGLITAALALTPSLAASEIAGDVARGRMLFIGQCSACHAATPGKTSVGPSLAGTMGRRAATVPGGKYSSALMASGLIWTPQNLNSFLADPQGIAPGTTMPIRIRSENDREDLISYLSSLK